MHSGLHLTWCRMDRLGVNAQSGRPPREQQAVTDSLADKYRGARRMTESRHSPGHGFEVKKKPGAGAGQDRDKTYRG
jgi:hypothetical protein